LLTPTLHIGVLWVRVDVVGSQSLKDRRRVLRSLKDRMCHRFEVSCHEVATDEHRHGQLVVTTGGAEGPVVSQVLDKLRAFLDGQGGYTVVDVRSEVLIWQPGEVSLWAGWEEEPDV
jgi:uncharacterized protein YlxP (DUF503 family)